MRRHCTRTTAEDVHVVRRFCAAWVRVLGLRGRPRSSQIQRVASWHAYTEAWAVLTAYGSSRGFQEKSQQRYSIGFTILSWIRPPTWKGGT
jgi:hypothetical protein